jgi:hypothetical protein
MREIAIFDAHPLDFRTIAYVPTSTDKSFFENDFLVFNKLKGGDIMLRPTQRSCDLDSSGQHPLLRANVGVEVKYMSGVKANCVRARHVRTGKSQRIRAD